MYGTASEAPGSHSSPYRGFLPDARPPLFWLTAGPSGVRWGVSLIYRLRLSGVHQKRPSCKCSCRGSWGW